MAQNFAVGVTLNKLASGRVHDLTRDEIFGVTNRRFLRKHQIDFAYADAAADFVRHAVRVRNSTHPHVKKLGLSRVMVSHNDAMKSLYQDIASKIIRQFESSVRGKSKNMAQADEEDEDYFEVPDLEKEAFLSNVEAILKQSKNPFHNLSSKYAKESYRAGHKAGSAKIVDILKATAPSLDDEFENEVVDGYVQSEGSYYDGLLDDIHDDVSQSFDTKAATKEDFVTVLASSIMGQFYRTDLFTSDMYRVAQDGQRDAFTEAEKKDPAGAEWKYKWVAVIDHLTCEECISLNAEPPKYIDEFEYDPGDVHLFCRCDLNPIPPNEEGEDGEDGGGDRPDGDQPDLFDNPNNTGFDPNLDAGEFDYDDLSHVPRNDDEANSILVRLKPERVQKYVEDTSFLDKVKDLQEGTVGGLRMKNLANLTDTHFSQKYDVNVRGAWSNREWWDRLQDSKKMKTELDMLGRLDNNLSAVSQTSAYKQLAKAGQRLTVSRDLNRVTTNAGFYNTATGSVHLHHGSLGSSPEFKDQIIAHEAAHHIDFGMRKANGKKWDKFRGDWDQVTKFGRTTPDNNPFTTPYAKRHFYKNINDRESRDIEDFAEAFSLYIHDPGIFKRNEAMQRKYKLLKDHIFDGVEFKRGQFNSLFD